MKLPTTLEYTEELQLFLYKLYIKWWLWEITVSEYLSPHGENQHPKINVALNKGYNALSIGT